MNDLTLQHMSGSNPKFYIFNLNHVSCWEKPNVSCSVKATRKSKILYLNATKRKEIRSGSGPKMF